MALQPSSPSIPELQDLSKAVESPEKLASGSRDIQKAALGATKFIFDLSIKSEESSLKHVNDLILSITPSFAPQTRSQKAAARQTAPPIPPKSLFTQTPLTSLFTDNLDEDQIWAQIDIRTKQLCEVLDIIVEGELPDDEDGEQDDFERRMREAQEEDFDFDVEEDSEEDSEEDDDSEEGGEEEMYEGFEGEGEEEEGEEEEEEEEGVMELENGSSDSEEDLDKALSEEVPSRMAPRKKKGGTSELDDGFFNLSSFKAEVEKAEARSSSRGRLADEDSEDSDEEIEDIDLFAPVDGEDDIEVEDDAKELFYSDFFEASRIPTAAKKVKAQPPPAGSRGVRFNDEVRVRKITPSGRGRYLREDEDDQLEDVMEDSAMDSASNELFSGDEDEENRSESEENEGRAIIERLKDDLLADDSDDEDPKDMTTHEKRMAALKEQINELETENVSQKHWTLMGEAGSKTRPQNSLLEEDLEFERVMKPTPVITEEVVQSLEELIKARVLENRYDDVVRLRPIDDKPFLPSRLLELKDTQSTQSLAQIYENEYIAAQSGGPAIGDRDGKLKQEHDEVEAQWDLICSKLDALSNAHFVPKQPKSLISTVANVSTATMESALPTSKSATSMLAPEEVFSAESSQPRARAELTPNEKRTRRAKERKAKRKQRDMLDRTVDKVAKMRGMGGVKKQKQAALESIVKHGKGVTIVGKAAKDLKARGKLPDKKP